MSLKSLVENKLGQVQQTPATIEADGPSGRFEADLDQVERLGYSFVRFQFRTDQLAGASRDRLQKIGEDLSKRLSYLMEPISPLEFDQDGFTLQLRSDPPAKDDDGATYYEILARRGGMLSLERYRKAPGQLRQVVSAHVTREVFLRLVVDFEQAVAASSP